MKHIDDNDNIDKHKKNVFVYNDKIDIKNCDDDIAAKIIFILILI